MKAKKTEKIQLIQSRLFDFSSINLNFFPLLPIIQTSPVTFDSSLFTENTRQQKCDIIDSNNYLFRSRILLIATFGLLSLNKPSTIHVYIRLIFSYFLIRNIRAFKIKMEQFYRPPIRLQLHSVMITEKHISVRGVNIHHRRR